MIPGLIIAAPASDSGKTLVTLALLRLLAREGRRVAPCKAGPDYIDPAFHAAAAGRASVNLDPWAMRPATIASLLADLAGDADLILCEGVMGLFDGAAGGAGSTADLAALTGWPVVLVVDAAGQAASAAALLRGFASHRRAVKVAGVLFNRTGGPRHGDMLRAAVADDLADLEPIAVLGCLPKDAALAMPKRHLGLVQAAERADLTALLNRAADWLADHVDLDALVALARPGRIAAAGAAPGPALPPLGQRIAVADDLAFGFCYPAVLDGWRAAGAEVMPFSPLTGDEPDPAADAVYLPGGYPELHAGRLAANDAFLNGLRAADKRGAAIFGECGGYMVLGEGLVDEDGARHALAGLLPLETSFAEPKLSLGYRHAAVRTAGPFDGAVTAFRGHEFHYAVTLREGPGDALFDCADAAGRSVGPRGLVAGRVAGSFVHLIDRAA